MVRVRQRRASGWLARDGCNRAAAVVFDLRCSRSRCIWLISFDSALKPPTSVYNKPTVCDRKNARVRLERRGQAKLSAPSTAVPGVQNNRAIESITLAASQARSCENTRRTAVNRRCIAPIDCG